jgi:hypothetical protein
LNLSLTSSGFFHEIKQIVDAHYTFRYILPCSLPLPPFLPPFLPHHFSLPISPSLLYSLRIPLRDKVVKYSPKNAVVYYPESSIFLIYYITQFLMCFLTVPPKVTKLTVVCFSPHYFHEFIDFFPPTLTHLSFQQFDGPHNFIFPPSLTHLLTVKTYEPPFHSLPPSLTHLTTFGFWHRTPYLPPNLTHLSLGRYYDQPLTNLPPTLTHLKLGSSFNQPIDHFPPSITHLQVGRKFRQPVQKLPASLTHLIVAEDFCLPLDNLPRTLTHLIAPPDFLQPLDTLPPTVSHVIFDRSLHFRHHHHFIVQENYLNKLLPSSITHLITSWYFDEKVDNLPQSLTHLTFGQRFRQPVIISLPL